MSKERGVEVLCAIIAKLLGGFKKFFLEWGPNSMRFYSLKVAQLLKYKKW